MNNNDYYPFGMMMPGRRYDAGSGYRYGFNNGEKLNEIYGESNYVDLGERGIDTRLGRLNWSIDPRSAEYPWQSPYAYFGNSPIAQLDYNGEGDYYDKKGKHLGSDDKNDNLTYTASRLVMKQIEKRDAEGNVMKGEDGKAIMENYKVFEGANLLNIRHSEFLKQAATIYGESSAYKTNGMTEELEKEMFAIGSVLQRNNVAYGAHSDQAKVFLAKSEDGRNGTKMQLANAAAINALTGGFDYSYGATNWDGIEQARFPDADKRYSTGGKRSWELHKNTIGWNISDEHYAKWQSYATKNKFAFQVPQVSLSVGGSFRGRKIKGGLTGFQSTAVYGGTIFWKSK